MYVELNQQIAALLSGGEEEEQEELRLLQQQLSDVCYRQANQLEHRQTLLQSAQSFHGSAHEVLHKPLLHTHHCYALRTPLLHTTHTLPPSPSPSLPLPLLPHPLLVLQLSQQLDGLLGMLCADVVPADGASIQQSLKQLEESLKAVGQ